jgi:hypothetical protein
MKRHHKLGRYGLVLGLSALMTACAGPGPKPTGELQSAETSIQQAEGADAREFEPVLLNEARNQVADAKELIDSERYREAEKLLEKAAVDAQLAMARSETQQAENAVEQINENIESLRQRLNAEQQ